jgi:CRP-like cAMP-binding protein
MQSVDIDRLVPRLAPGTHLEETLALRVVGVGAVVDLAPDEAAFVALVDGHRTLSELARAGVDAAPAVRPLRGLGALRRLHQAGLVQGLEPGARVLFGREKGALRRRLGQLGQLHVYVAALGRPLALGVRLPARLLRPFSLAALFAWVAVLALSVADNRGAALFDPLPPTRSALGLLLWLYLGAVALLSVRDLLRGLALSSLGLRVPRAGVRMTWGVLHLGIDTAHRGGAPTASRVDFALVGLAAHAAVGAGAGMVWLITGAALPHMLAALGSLALLVDLAPYSRSDAWHLGGIATRLPSQRRRTLRFLLVRVGRNLRRRGRIVAEERRLLGLASLWLLHAVVVVGVLSERLLPSSARLLTGALRAPAEVFAGEVAAAGLAFATMTGALLLYASAMALVAVAVVWALIRPVPRRPHSDTPEPAAVQALREAAMDAPALAPAMALAGDALASAAVRERHAAGSTVVQQGTPGAHLFFLRSGTAVVQVEEASGYTHPVAALGPGSLFGAAALVEDAPRTATVRATSPCEVLALSRADFDAALEGLDAAEARMVLRVAALIRTTQLFAEVQPGPLRDLQRAALVRPRTAGQTLVAQGAEGDGVYLVLEGTCEVRHQAPGEVVHRLLTELGPGDWFGEIAVLHGGRRTASVVAVTDMVLVRLPGEAVRDALLSDFQAALAFDAGAAARLNAQQLR